MQNTLLWLPSHTIPDRSPSAVSLCTSVRFSGCAPPLRSNSRACSTSRCSIMPPPMVPYRPPPSATSSFAPAVPGEPRVCSATQATNTRSPRSRCLPTCSQNALISVHLMIADRTIRDTTSAMSADPKRSASTS